jgi:outer membrane protein OmpA-like peptidoglycan-associated protein
VESSRAFRRSVAAIACCSVLLPSAALAAEVPYIEAWDAATVAAAEAAVARLGGKTSLSLKPSVLKVPGLQLGVAGKSVGLVAKVGNVQQAMRDLGARETDLEVRVDLPADVLFDFDKADIRADAAGALAKVATLIRNYPKASTQLTGHTDSVGADDYNLALSQRRAEAVKRWLIEREKLDGARLEPRGMGETKPVAANDTEAGRQKNRRVEVLIRKAGK